ncbi:hypothetical protein BDA99DRAFT_503965 [Phascolomyces articulosus]|uniref:Sulfide:quinone oxidoreductase, mitochondrial n=1 Tax=Phascolomyces articulosus TaxID=60185 RepID=A0AAD5K507_9FUNG|nr:hypothetical protein BDA99DRAFT_503965 [Phascolomyces articulosus]
MLSAITIASRNTATRQLLSGSSKRSFASVVNNHAVTIDKKYKVVVVGAGPGGLSVASTISKLLGKDQVAIIDPAQYHYYQPLWTYVGGGLKDFKESQRPMASLIPEKADWVQDSVTKVEPDSNHVVLSDGTTVGYDYLVVAAGIQVNWDQIKGLKESLGKDGVTSNYSPESVQKTYQFLQNFKGGNALFSYPNSAIKCPGAPTKIVFLAEEIFRMNSVRDKANVIYNSFQEKLYGIDHYGEVIHRLARERSIVFNPRHELIEIQPNDRKAIFRIHNQEGEDELTTYDYDFLHAVPPQSPPAFIKESKLADPVNGFVDVDKYTLRHNKYKNVFSLGDCSNLPTGKTAAAITVESGVLKTNLIADLQGKKIKEAEYDGYASCPLVVGRKELVLAEFSGYTGKTLETFPMDQRKVSGFNAFINKEIIPSIYWNGLLTGRWTGPTEFRKLFNHFRSTPQ